VKVAVVPFSQYVNVGVENRAASWLKLSDIPADQTWVGCVRSRLLGIDTIDGAPEKPYQILLQQTSLLPNEFCPTPLTPLTADKSVVMTAVDAMVMSGQTYIPAGLMWGWNVLTHDAPFTEARAKGVRKAMVLMTDGSNSRSHFAYGIHEGTDIPAAVRTMLTLCRNIKQAGIHVYTVAFDPPVAERAVVDQLKECASDSGSAFVADDSTAFIQAFGDITRQLQRLRLSC
jgi:von Willebrand factor type A domain